MDHEESGGSVASWSTHHIPAGSAIRYVLDSGDDAPIRLIIGDHEQVELGMVPSQATSIITALQAAARDVQTRGDVEMEAAKP